MSIITITKVRPEIKQAWVSKQDAIIYFGYTNHKRVFQDLLREFKEHKDFGEGYILATAGVPIVNIELFEKFLRWREVNKYKRNRK